VAEAVTEGLEGGGVAAAPPSQAAVPAALRRDAAPGPRAWQLWLGVFAYAALVAAVLQLVVLPYVLPDLHEGDGLFAGLDSHAYHEYARQKAKEIRAVGWRAWALRPRGHGNVGIAAAIYVLTGPRLWALIPLYAALHASAALVLLRMIEVLVRDRRAAVWAVLPFAFYPSAVVWYSQALKDGWFVLGVLLFAYGWLGLSRLESWTGRPWPAARAAVWVVAGTACVWLVRPYAVLMLHGVALVLAGLVSGVFVARGVRGSLGARRVVAAVAVAWSLVGIASQFPQATGTPTEVLDREFPPGPPSDPGLARWRDSAWLPGYVDRRLRELALVRDGYRLGYLGAGTNIDVEVEFRTARDVVAYLPRAATIVLLAPFPVQWVEEGVTPGGTLMRRVAAVEMLGLYAALALVPYALWRGRRRVEVYTTTLYAVGMMLIFATAITNIGVLYRLRYAFLMTLAALGLAAWLAEREGRRRGVA
jgi:hypothetical protein